MKLSIFLFKFQFQTQKSSKLLHKIWISRMKNWFFSRKIQILRRFCSIFVVLVLVLILSVFGLYWYWYRYWTQKFFGTGTGTGTDRQILVLTHLYSNAHKRQLNRLRLIVVGVAEEEVSQQRRHDHRLWCGGSEPDVTDRRTCKTAAVKTAVLKTAVSKQRYAKQRSMQNSGMQNSGGQRALKMAKRR